MEKDTFSEQHIGYGKVRPERSKPARAIVSAAYIAAEIKETGFYAVLSGIFL